MRDDENENAAPAAFLLEIYNRPTEKSSQKEIIIKWGKKVEGR